MCVDLLIAGLWEDPLSLRLPVSDTLSFTMLVVADAPTLEHNLRFGVVLFLSKVCRLSEGSIGDRRYFVLTVRSLRCTFHGVIVDRSSPSLMRDVCSTDKDFLAKQLNNDIASEWETETKRSTPCKRHLPVGYAHKHKRKRRPKIALHQQVSR